jgi:hypothetical protein
MNMTVKYRLSKKKKFFFAVSEICYEIIRQDSTPNFHTLEYNCYSFKSKHALAV